MDAKVTVEERIADVLLGEQWNYETWEEALVETLRLAQSQLAERDAQIKRAETLVAARDMQIVERELQIAEMRTHVQAIQRETHFHERGGEIDLARDLGTIGAMCEAILNPDFAAELGLTEANDGHR